MNDENVFEIDFENENTPSGKPSRQRKRGGGSAFFGALIIVILLGLISFFTVRQ